MHGNRVALVFVVAILTSRSLVACLCGGGKVNARAELQFSSAVFEGRVVGTHMRIGSEHGWLFPVPVYRFRVLRAWKGVSSSDLLLLGGYSDCATTFAVASTYLVFAGPHETAPRWLSSSKCGATKLSSAASIDRTILGPPMLQFAPPENKAAPTANVFQAYLIGGVAGYANIVGHPYSRFAWTSIGIISVVLMSAGIIIVSIGTMRHHKRVAKLFCVHLCGLAVIVIALLVGGHALFQNSWFSQYLK